MNADLVVDEIVDLMDDPDPCDPLGISNMAVQAQNRTTTGSNDD